MMSGHLCVRRLWAGQGGHAFHMGIQMCLERQCLMVTWIASKPASLFPVDIVAQAESELNQLAVLLEQRGIQVYRLSYVDWMQHGGYTGAMPRDGLIIVGHHLIEAPFAWECR
jgi:hypothetical protein